MNRVLDIGNCGPDHAAIRCLIGASFPGSEVVQAHGLDDALTALKSKPFNLILVNRKLDLDYSDGLDVIRQVKANSAATGVPVIMLSNYPEFQAEAVAVGAEPGFGKKQYDEPETLAILGRYSP